MYQIWFDNGMGRHVVAQPLVLPWCPPCAIHVCQMSTKVLVTFEQVADGGGKKISGVMR